MEFGADWLFYVVGRLGHYLPSYRADSTVREMGRLPQKAIEEYLTAGRLFVSPEAHDPMLPQEMALIGERQILFSSDFPHGEGRDNAADELLDRRDLSETQKRQILYDNAVGFYGEP
jgi:predicted TIM-barrel fold metal-dependent hydrolase